MKSQILKHTGLSEKQFYAKYKSADDFFNSKEGKSFQKAQGGGTYMGTGNVPQRFGTGIPQNTQIPQLLQDPFQSSSLTKSGLPTDPIQGEITDAMSLIRQPRPGELEAETAHANQQILGLSPSVTPITPPKGAGNFGPTQGASLVGDAISAFQAFGDQRNKRREAEMWRDVTGVQLQASRTRPEQYDRKYIRPEDQTITGEELFPVHGVGTNPIAQNGSMIGSSTEVEDMFDPYEDFGYQPLNDSEIKQYQIGGNIAGAISGPATAGIGTYYDNNAGFQTGKTIGSAAKFIPGIGPIASAIAEPVLGFIGGQLDKTFGDAGKIAKAQSAIDRNIGQMQLGQQAASVQAGYASHLEDGGNVNPQIIKSFGKHSLKSLLKPDPMMDTLQSGGELQTHWGGYAEPISQNPYLPDGGQTVMFRGNSHRETDGNGNTGIGITYGNTPVEVESGEPAMKLQDGSGDPNMVVFGNLPINKNNANLLGDPKATNKKFKNYIADLSKQEANSTKTLDKNTLELNSLEVNDPFDKLKFASHQANMMGSNMTLKSIADKKQKAALLQNAINETRNELSDKLGYTISAEQLAKDGRITKDRDPVTKGAKYGLSIDKAVTGKRLPPVEDIDPPKGAKGNVNPYQQYGHIAQTPGALDYTEVGPTNTSMFSSPEAYAAYKKETEAAYADPERARQLVDYFKNYEGPDWQDVRSAINKGKTYEEQRQIAQALATDYKPGRYHINTAQFKRPTLATPPIAPVTDISLKTQKPSWMSVLGAAMPYLRPSNAGRLDPNQLMGEMFALSQNQVDPVQAQTYQPQLDVPYDISLQDQLNQVTKQSRAAQRMAGYNPAAQAMIASSAYDPANQILGEQFRMNQAMKDRVYSGNRATMNEARMKNLGIYDQQAQRLSQAVSNTKQVAQAALSSIADKYQRNALENKTLQTYENLYNYRFGPGQRAYNVNAPFIPNIPQVYYGDERDVNPSDIAPLKTKDTKEVKSTKDKKTSRNGSIVKSLKRM